MYKPEKLVTPCWRTGGEDLNSMVTSQDMARLKASFHSQRSQSHRRVGLDDLVKTVFWLHLDSVIYNQTQN